MKRPGFIARHSPAVIQAFIWTLLAVVPVVSIFLYNAHPAEGVISWVIMVSSWMAMFYINYYLLIPRVLFRNATARFIGANAVCALVLTVLVHLIAYVCFEQGGSPDLDLEVGPEVILGFCVYLTFYLFIVLAAISIRSLQRSARLEKQRNRAEREQSAMELARLKSQLNPHFLFNSLNNISALAALDPEKAQEAIATLSSMLRYVLYDTAAPQVPLAAEARFVHDYVKLMSMRYTGSLRLDFTSDFPEESGARVPPMLFISLIENAFKYGASSTHPSEISIDVRLHRPSGTLTMRVTNTLLVPGVSAPMEKVRPEKRGVGLVNLRRRLEILFPERHVLSCGVTSSGLYEAVISIPLAYVSED